MRASFSILILAALLSLPPSAGAEHWAFEPRNAGAPPVVKDEAWPANAIDRYVLARLEKAGIAPSPEADRATLIRRLALDLTGLPPTFAEAERYVRDLSVNAYERIVDQYLNSPQFAENWAWHWLEQARYADTDTFANWRWRDWVIDSIGRDVPFDRFTRDQMGGDLLPDATKEQQLATAFHVQPPSGEDASSEEMRVKRVIARTNNTARVWLGLNVSCSQCHEHPTAPLAPTAFAGLFAFFNNATETEIVVGKTFRDIRELHPLEQALNRAREAARPAFANWLQDTRAKLAAAGENPADYHPVDGEKLSLYSETGNDLEVLEDGSVRAGGPLLGTDLYIVRFPSPVAEITGFRIETLVDSALPNNGPGAQPDGNFILSEFRAFVQPEPDKPPRGLPFLRASADFSQTDFEVGKAIDGNPGTGWGIAPEMGIPHHADFLLARPLEGAGEMPVMLNLVQELGVGKGHLLARFRVLVRSGGKNEVDLPEKLRNLVALDTRSIAQDAEVFEYFVSNVHPETVSIRADLDEKRANTAVTVRVLHERNEERRAPHRFGGEDSGASLPATPAFLPPLVAEGGAEATRLDLARWLAAAENPLTARVIGNEIWSHFIGRGLISPEVDFGPGGTPPSHPELLDWLADELVRNGWSRKKLIREIILSRTYRQASAERADATVLDPHNRLLHRQNQLPLASETLRDIRLAASGLLDRTMGGPGGDPQAFRRSLYHIATPAAPTGTAKCPEFPSTPSPPREIAELLTESTAALARALLTTKSMTTDDERLGYAYKLILTRAPSSEELQRLSGFLEDRRNYYRENADAAIMVPEPEGVSPEENAAWIATLRDVMDSAAFKSRR